MLRTTLLFLGVVLLAVLAVSWFGPFSIVPSAETSFKAGDAVTVVEDANLTTANHRAVLLSAGTTVTVKKANGGSIQVDAEGGTVGWIPAKTAIPLDTAVAYFTGLVDRAPTDPHNYYFRAGVFQTNGEYDRAIEDYDRAIRLGPARPAYYIERATCLLGKKDFAQAIASANEALKLEPKAAGAYMCRGGAYCETGDYAHAMADWSIAGSLAPDAVAPRANLAELLACCPDPRWRNGQKAAR